MIVRRYGSSVQSVELNFDSRAMTEIGFRRDQEWSVPTEEFEQGWEKVEEYSLEATSEGDVQDTTEQALLARLEAQIREIEDVLTENELLRVESEQGKDYPKTRHSTRTVLVEGENRLHFRGWVEPPLRLARYRRRA
jgi:hypothetical protein